MLLSRASCAVLSEDRADARRWRTQRSQVRLILTVASSKQILKRVVTEGLHGSGILAQILRHRTRGRAIVLTYHRVLPMEARANSFSAEGIIVSPETFRRQMLFLREHMRPMTMAEFSACLSRGRFPAAACMVTFDDGWKDNYRYAFPILRETGVPAALFVATAFIGSRRTFWQEALSRLVFEVARCERGRSAAEELGIGHACGREREDAQRTIRNWVTSLKACPQPRIEAILGLAHKSAAALGLSIPNEHCDQFLDWEDLLEMQSSGTFSIGSHCSSHTPLTKLTSAAARAELRESRSTIARHLNARPDFLAYPNGDADESVVEAAMAEGYVTAFTTERGYVSSADPRLTLRRINVHEFSSDTDAKFMARLARVF